MGGSRRVGAVGVVFVFIFLPVLRTVDPAGYPPDNFRPKRIVGIFLLPLLSACHHHQLLYWPSVPRYYDYFLRPRAFGFFPTSFAVSVSSQIGHPPGGTLCVPPSPCLRRWRLAAWRPQRL